MQTLRRAIALLACVALIDMPPLAMADENSASAPASDGVRIKQIGKTSAIALMVLDKNCPEMVQPYKLTDNAASLAVFAAKENVGDLAKRLTDMLKRRSIAPAAAATTKISQDMRSAAKQLNWLPMEVETMYGERSHETETNVLSRESKLGQKYYPIADGILAEILGQLSEPHDYAFKLFVLKNSSRNAVARPGGYLYIDQGLLEAPETLPKAYFALAHEIAHVLQRHETRALQNMVVDSFTVKDELTKAVTAARTDPAAVLSRVKVGKNVYARHYSDQELQADSCAARLLARVYPQREELAGVLDAFLRDLAPSAADARAPAGAPRTAATAAPAAAAERVVTEAQDIVTTPAARHPTTQERIQNLRAMYAEVAASLQSSAER